MDLFARLTFFIPSAAALALGAFLVLEATDDMRAPAEQAASPDTAAAQH
ncbi:MAG: hypothetical protein AAGH83_05460 [Pseudomonadota bacterium]